MKANIDWAYISYGIVWVATAVAVIAAVYITKSALPLWAMFIPTLVSFKRVGTKRCYQCGKSVTSKCDACGNLVCEEHRIEIAYDTHVCLDCNSEQERRTAIKRRITEGFK